MPIPDYQTLMLPVLRRAASGPVKMSDCLDGIAQEFDLTADEITEMLPSGRQAIFYNRCQWAKTFMSKAGLLESAGRGYFQITEAGQQLLSENPQKISNATLEQYPQFVQWKEISAANKGQTERISPAPIESDKATPEERIESDHAALMAELRSEVLDRILDSTPAFFEQLIIDLLLAMGYGGGRAEMGRAIGRSGDGGIDGIIKEDALGLDIIYIQAKRYSPGNSVGRPEVQSFAGSLDGVGANKGLFVTTSSFSSGAREYSERIAKRIILIDGDELARLLIRHDVGVRTRNTFEVKKLDEDYFSE